MWGDKPARQIRLLDENVSEFQDPGIPIKNMSIIYREAIRVTRALGYQYILIDSLCIIQDSQSDWEEEASKMAAVYGNAVCNISYLFPPEDAEPKPRKDPRGYSRCVLRQMGGSEPGIYACRPPSRRESEIHACWPLSTRAWAFQEQVLSPRTVYYGDSNLMWECCAGFSDELHGEFSLYGEGLGLKHALVRDHGHIGTLRRIPKIPKSSLRCGQIGFLRIWERLIDNYRRRKLTKESDRIMAFAGIARAVNNLYGLTYLAGMWKEGIQPLLLWAIKPERPTSPTMPQTATENRDELEPQTGTATPSWSWFSIPTSRFYTPLGVSTVYDTAASVLLWTKLLSFGWNKQLENEIPASSFYDFTGLHLTLEAMTLTTHLDRLDGGGLALDSTRFSPNAPLKIQSTTYWHDGTGTMVGCKQGDSISVTLACIVLFWHHLHDSVEPHRCVIQGLALTPCSDQNAWKRVGMWEIGIIEPRKEPEEPLIETGEWVFAQWEGWKLAHITLV